MLLATLLQVAVVELPFVVFALLMPFISHGPRTEVLGLTVSEPGLVAGTAGSLGAGWVGGQIFGEGSKGQRILTFVGGLGTGMLGSRAAGKGLMSYREGVARNFYLREGLTYDPKLGALPGFESA